MFQLLFGDGVQTGEITFEALQMILMFIGIMFVSFLIFKSNKRCENCKNFIKENEDNA